MSTGYAKVNTSSLKLSIGSRFASFPAVGHPTHVVVYHFVNHCSYTVKQRHSERLHGDNSFWRIQHGIMALWAKSLIGHDSRATRLVTNL